MAATEIKSGLRGSRTSSLTIAGDFDDLQLARPKVLLPGNARRVSDFNGITAAFGPREVTAVLVPSARPALASLSEELQYSLQNARIDIYESTLDRIFRDDRKLASALLPSFDFSHPQDQQFISALRKEVVELAKITQTLAGTKALRILIAHDLGIDPGPHCDPAVVGVFKIFGLTTEFYAATSASYDDTMGVVQFDPKAPLYWPEQNEILFHYGYRPGELPERALPYGAREPLVHQAAERWKLEDVADGSRPPRSLTVVVSADL